MTPLRLLLLSFPLLLAGLAPAQAAGRSVALVYDDSGSMRSDDRWLYANYALETLIALLGRDDELHLVAMSRPERDELLADNSARSRAIERLKQAKAPAKNTPTPYRAVRTAMAALPRTGGEGEERWLVVITDGVFDEDGPAPDPAAREREFVEFISATGAHPIVLLIGEGADRRLAESWRRHGQAEVLQAADSGEIVDRVRDIATLLNSRDSHPADLGEVRRGGEIVLSPRFPLRRLTVLSQGDGRGRRLARVSGVSAEAGELQREQYELAMVRPPKQGGRSEGVVTHVAPKGPGGFIPEGRERLRIALDAGAEGADLRIYPEVAARLDVELRDGKGARLIPDARGETPVCIGQKVRIVSRLMADGGRTLTEGQADTSGFEAAFFLDDAPAGPMPLNAAKTEFTGEFTTRPGTATLSAGASYPGYFHFRSRVFRLAGAECKPKAVSVDVDASGWRGRLPDLESGSVRLAPKLDGAPLAPGEFAGWKAELAGATPLRFDLERDGQAAQWVLRPRLRWGCVCFSPTGPQPVRITVETDDGRRTEIAVPLSVADMGWWEKCRGWVLGLLALLALLWYAVGIAKKPRFRPGAVVFHERGGRRSTWPLPGSWGGRWLVPYLPERRGIGEVVFKAGRSGAQILLAKEAQHERMSVGGLPLDDPGRRDLPLANGEALKIAGRQPESYTYSSG